MDPVSGTASVLTLLSFALGSAKFIHQAISSIKHGPSHLHTFTREVETLQKVLEQFSAYHHQLPSSGLDLEVVSSLVNACNDDLRRYKTEITKAQCSAGNKVELVWKRIRSVVRERDVQRMEREIHNHATKLGGQLSRLQHKSCNDQFNGQLSQIRDTLKTQTEGQGKALALLQKQDSCLSNGDENSAATHAASGLPNENLQGAINAMQQTVAGMPEAMSKQFEALQAGLSGLTSHVEALKSLQTNVLQNVDTGKKDDDVKDLAPDPEVLESISRLCRLTRHNATTLHDADAAEVIDDLEMMIESMSKHLVPSSRVPNPPRKRSINAVEGSVIDYRDIKRMKGLLISSPSIDVNWRSASSTPTKSKRFVRERQIEEVDTPYGRFLVILTHKQLLLYPDTLANDGESIGQPTTELIATIKRMPERSTLQATIAAHVHKRMIPNGCQSLYPSVLVGITLPKGHDVFSMMRTGDLAGFQRLLDQGKAALKSYDEDGVPLLHYALQHPIMCRFLLDQGADIDEVAKDMYSGPCSGARSGAYWGDVEDYRPCSPLEVILGDYQLGDLDYDFNHQEPRRLLLDRADPTRTALRRAISNIDEASVRSLLDSAGSPDFLNPRHEDRLTPLHHALVMGNISIIELLIKRGANVNARDPLGVTCLQFCFTKYDCFNPCHSLRVLLLVLRGGADINAIDNGGKSMTEYVYTLGYRNGFPGDLWDRSLVECGYDLFERRQNFPRTPLYRRDSIYRYTREDFEQLWKGRESDCPYYDDPPQWPSQEEPEETRPCSVDETEDDELDTFPRNEGKHEE